MLYPGIILCLTGVIMCQTGIVTGDDTVVVQLQTGQRLRAHAISQDPQMLDRVTLSIGNEQILIRRNVAWSRVNRLVAPAEMLVDLKIPDNVKVIDSTAHRARQRELTLTLAPEQAEQNMTQLRQFLRVTPSPSVSDVPPSPLPFDGPMEPSSEPTFMSVMPPFVTRSGSDPAWPSIQNSESIGAHESGPAFVSPCNGILINIPRTAGPIFVRDPGVIVGIRYADPNLPCVNCGADSAFVQSPRNVGAAMESSDPRELVVSARAFNRNGLADWNSLEVLVQGRTASGQPCRVRGSLKCALWVRRTRLVRAYGENFFEEPRDIYLLGQWSQFLDGSETDANGVQKIVLALPPRSSDHNLNVGQFGLLQVDLDIPGQGRLATSTDAISLRQVGPNRSRSVTNFGSSILPAESVSEGIIDAGNWPAPLSGIRPDSRRFTVQP